ncbi:ATP-binding cassette domain-containing protein [Rheinheimera sp. D18]|uniref:SPOR domain-containing protein n=1 Tax=Rheinheimera sp. D18 TaxID=2545632 RepID=UPI0010531B3F|nr:AAA family ATPase [Rheinheimera sp. D18]QBL10167.1 ATP-binding cassette domain-containing protein [Rheinheimera sp. D18]
MDITNLQRRLPELTYLLPSQQEWMERLLLQLAFNDNKHIYIVGADGSGKSTLAMNIAELFSEQHNIALLNSTVEESQVHAQLMQQWFNLPADPNSALVEQVLAAYQQQPLLVIIDDAERYSAELLQQISLLPCLQFCFSADTQDNAALTLTINRISSADAQQLLSHEELNSIELAERLANANGNMHLLLLPVRQSYNERVVADNTTALVNKTPLYIAIAAVLLVILLYIFWPKAEKPVQEIRYPVARDFEAKPVPVVTETPPAVNTEAELSKNEQQPLGLDVSEPVQTELAEATKSNTSSIAEAKPVADAKLDAGASVKPEVAPVQAVDTPVVENTSAEPVYAYDEALLLKMPKNQLAVQLAVLSSAAALQRFKKTYPQLTTLSYQRNWQGKMQLVILLAPFADAASVKVQLKQLPEALRATGPFVKVLQSVQTEIKARQYSAQD